MNQSVRVIWDELRSATAAEIVAGPHLIGGTAFEHPIRLLVMQNYTDEEVLISFDGDTDHMVLPAGGQIVLDYASDASAVAGMWSMAIGDAVWLAPASANPTTGNFYVSAAYGKGE